MSIFTTTRLATKDEIADEMDRRGAVIETLETNVRHWREECGKLHARLQEAEEKLRLANTGSLTLLYDIRRALGWNDKTSLSILADGVRRVRRALQTWDTPTGMDLEALAMAVKARVEELEQLAADAKRLSGCLIAIHQAPESATIGALKSVAYDAALNCITPDVAEFQIERRSDNEIAARNERAEREADAREA